MDTTMRSLGRSSSDHQDLDVGADELRQLRTGQVADQRGGEEPAQPDVDHRSALDHPRGRCRSAACPRASVALTISHACCLQAQATDSTGRSSGSSRASCAAVITSPGVGTPVELVAWHHRGATIGQTDLDLAVMHRDHGHLDDLADDHPRASPLGGDVGEGSNVVGDGGGAPAGADWPITGVPRAL